MNSPKSIRSVFTSAMLMAFLWGASSLSARAVVLVSDNFNDAAGTNINGRNLPVGSAAWVVKPNESPDTLEIDGSGHLVTNFVGSSAPTATVALNAGNYNQYAIEATVNLASKTDVSVWGLGFDKNPNSFYVYSELTLQLRPNKTSNQLELDGPYDPTGASGHKTIALAMASIPDFDPATTYNIKLVYNAVNSTASVLVNGATIMDGIAVVDVNGNSYSPNLNYAEICYITPKATGDNTLSQVWTDDFSVTAMNVPEPASLGWLGLFVIGGGVMLARRRVAARSAR